MSGYIRVDKELPDDPRVIALADLYLEQLVEQVCQETGAAQVSVGLRDALRDVTRNAVLGGLASLWSYADTYLQQGDALPVTLEQASRVTLLPVTVLRAFPAAWLVENTDGSVVLPGYTDKNSLTTKEKRKALARARSARWRAKKTPKGDASVTRHAVRTSSVTPERHNVTGDAHSRGRARARDPLPLPSSKNPSLTLPASGKGTGADARDEGQGRRADGTNPRALGTNPRANGVHARAPRDASSQAFDMVIASVGKSQYGHVRDTDELAHLVVMELGGYRRIGQMTPHEVADFKPRFREAYEKRLQVPA